MGRPRRGNAAVVGKENAVGQSARGTTASRHASRPWDNLKPVRASLTASAARAFRDRAQPAHAAKAAHKKGVATGSERARLPHERFTPLLRTTFTDESCAGTDSGKPNEVKKGEERRSNADDVDHIVLERHRVHRARKKNTSAEANLDDEPSSAPVLTVSRDTKDSGSDPHEDGPLYVSTLPGDLLRSKLPIPKIPRSPTRASNRHSLRVEPAVHKIALSDDEDGDDLGPFDAITAEEGGDRKALDNLDFGSLPNFEVEEDDNHPFQSCDKGNVSFEHLNSVNDTSASPSLDGFRRSVRMSLRHSHVRTSDMRHSIRGVPVDHSVDLRQPSIQEFEDDLIIEPPPLPEDISTSSENFSIERDFEGTPACTSQGQDPIAFLPGHSRNESAQKERGGLLGDAFENELASHALVDTQNEKLNLSIAPPELQIATTAARIPTDASEKPHFPDITRVGATRKNDGGSRNMKDLKLSRGHDTDDDGDLFDAPSGITKFHDVEPAFRDLQRTSIKAGHELAVVAFGASTAQMRGAPARDRVSRAQGELLLKSRYFRRWHSRYASVVDHAYFGAVLFLFCLDAKDVKEGVVLKNSKMIVLADTRVQEVDVRRRGRILYLLELRTSQRKYVFACEDKRQRDYWLSNFTRCET